MFQVMGWLELVHGVCLCLGEGKFLVHEILIIPRSDNNSFNWVRSRGR